MLSYLAVSPTKSTRCNWSHKLGHSEYLIPSDSIIVLYCASRFAEKSNLSSRLDRYYTEWSETDSQFYISDNFGDSTPILTILSLLQAEIYGT